MGIHGLPPFGGPQGIGGPFGGFNDEAGPVLKDLQSLKEWSDEYWDGTLAKKYPDPLEMIAAYEAGVAWGVTNFH